jgi:Ca2+/Na+ antiporter
VQKGYFTRSDALLMMLSLIFYTLITYQVTKKDLGKRVDLMMDNESKKSFQTELKTFDLIMEKDRENRPRTELKLLDLIIQSGNHPEKQAGSKLQLVDLSTQDANYSINQAGTELQLVDLITQDANHSERTAKRELKVVDLRMQNEDTSLNRLKKNLHYIGLAILGFAGITLCSYVIIQSIIYLSAELNISEYIISFFMVSIGTSLPELSVDVSAIRNKNYRIAMGDLVGSCIVDSTLSIGIGQFLFPQQVAASIAVPTILYALFGALIVILVAAKREVIDKKVGILFILIYLLSFPGIFFIENILVL